MKQSNNKKSRDVTAFLYERLSRDDNLEGESYSIGNQKKLLAKVAKEKGYTNLVHFLDDGISGVTMDRPGFVEMICQLEQGKAAAVFVKDLSRLGRNYIEVGRLTEEFFPNHDIRLVAVSDNIDTAEGENELAPIRNLFNEWYARDISKKRRISNKIKGNAGEPMGLDTLLQQIRDIFGRLTHPCLPIVHSAKGDMIPRRKFALGISKLCSHFTNVHVHPPSTCIIHPLSVPVNRVPRCPTEYA